MSGVGDKPLVVIKIKETSARQHYKLKTQHKMKKLVSHNDYIDSGETTQIL